MTSKGQKFAKYTDDLIKEIVEKLRNGRPATRLTKEYNIP